MKACLAFVLSIMLAWPLSLWAADDQQTKTDIPPDIPKEDMAVIKYLDVLEMMEMAENFHLLQDMDILLKEDENEDTD